jgi:SAM-dependent methyltransferase
MKKSIPFLLLYLILTPACFSQKYIGEFAELEFNLSAKRLSFFVDMFETEKQLYDFLRLKPGDTVAEVGAGDGSNLGVLSMLYDSLTLYAQDISAQDLSESNWKRTLSYYAKKRVTPARANKFARVIGTVNASSLPVEAFDLVLLIDAYHDFDRKDEMIADLYTKLKPGGRIMILDGFSFPGDTVACPDAGKHVLTTLPVEIARFEKHGLYLTQLRSPDYRAHYGNGVVFEKDKAKSDAYYAKKNLVDDVVRQSASFTWEAVANDSLRMKQITDSLRALLSVIASVYPEYEVWVKDLGLRHLRKGDAGAATRIMGVNTALFPGSYQAWYWLALCHEISGRPEQALGFYQRSLLLNPKNTLARSKIGRLSKRLPKR